MGVIVVHNGDDEPVILRGALVAVWEALDEPRTDRDLVAVAAAGSASPGDIRRSVEKALEELRAVRLVARSE